ncbi:MAG TPA: hypothetical protein VJX74_12960, partial [Blastocatellia bacterium]|nr:hypothetical protein [Blastocatellia bacterium]
GKLVGTPRVSFRMLNGLPAILFEDVVSTATRATCYTIHVEVDDAGCIRRLDAVLAPNKLTAISEETMNYEL